MDVKKLFFKNEGQAKTFYSVITGIIAGTVNGLFGGGGGMIVVPMLMIFLKRSENRPRDGDTDNTSAVDSQRDILRSFRKS